MWKVWTQLKTFDAQNGQNFRAQTNFPNFKEPKSNKRSGKIIDMWLTTSSNAHDIICLTSTWQLVPYNLRMKSKGKNYSYVVNGINLWATSCALQG